MLVAVLFQGAEGVGIVEHLLSGDNVAAAVALAMAAIGTTVGFKVLKMHRDSNVAAAEELKGIGERCHEHATQREERFIDEIRTHRHETTQALARLEDRMGQSLEKLGSALDRMADAERRREA
ncbi:MAG: hypothetical protein AAF682_19705 [Planctomycetota bacterium]